MAKHVVTEFGIEVQFSEKVMAGLTRLESNVMKAAVNMERALNRAFKTNGAKVMEQTLGKIVRDTNNASRQMKKALQDAFDIKNAGRPSIRGFENDARAAARRVAKQFRDSMRFSPIINPPHGPPRPPLPPRGGGGGGGLSHIERQDRWMASHNVRTTENGMTNTMQRLGMTNQLGAFRESMNQVMERHKGTGNTQAYEREARQVINSYKNMIHAQREYTKALERSRFMQNSFTDSTRNMMMGMVSLYTIVAGFQKAIKDGRARQSANMASDAVFTEAAPDDKQAGLKSRVWAAGFARQIGQSYTDTVKGVTAFTASAAPSMGVDGSQNFYKQASIFARMRGLGGEQMKRAMVAFEQMASKGQIYAEELKGQLAEAMPGSEQMFAKAIYGSSSKENVAKMLNDMKLGLLKAADVLPKVAKEMERQTEAAGGLAKISQMTAVKLDNASAEMDGFFASIFKGMDKGLGTFAESIANMFYANNGIAEDFGGVLSWVFDKLTDVINIVATIGRNLHGAIGMVKIWYSELDPVTKKFVDGLIKIFDALSGAVLQMATIMTALTLIKSSAGIIGGLMGLKGAGAAAGAAGEAGAAGAAGLMAGVGVLIPYIVAAVVAYMAAGAIFDDKINAHGQKTLAGGNIIQDSPVGIAWQGLLDAGNYIKDNLNLGLHSNLVDEKSKLPPSVAAALNNTVVIPPDAFKDAKMPMLRGHVTIDVVQPDGSIKTQTIDMISDHTESMFTNTNPMGGGWNSPSSNVGWQQNLSGGTK